VAHDRLLSTIKGTGDLHSQYQAVSNRKQVIPKSIPSKFRLKRIVRRNGSTVTGLDDTTGLDEILEDEIKYVRDKLNEWMTMAEVQISRQKHKEYVDQAGTGVDCACCFDSFAIDDMVSCKDEGHLFCCDCLKHHAETLMFGAGNLGVDPMTKKPALELLCFHSDGCRSGFTRSSLEKALPTQSIEKYDTLQFQIRYGVLARRSCRGFMCAPQRT